MRIMVLLFVFAIGRVATGQTFSEKIHKELTFEKPSRENTVILSNINGSVKVTGYDGDRIVVEADKRIQGKTAERLEKGRQEVQLGIIDRADTLILFVRDGCNRFGEKDGGRAGGWGYESTNDCHLTYSYKVDFTVKVPASAHLRVSTINEGNVIVENTTGEVIANNINGSITLTNVRNRTQAHTINGGVDIFYAQNPDKDSRFYTLNGDINALFQPGLSADLTFESFNGDLYTNIPKMEALPVQVKKTDNRAGVRYEISGHSYQVGSGGALLRFETFNGNVYIKEKK